MKNTCWIVELEPIDSRYTKQWYSEIPRQLEKYMDCCDPSVNVVTLGTNGVSGNDKVSSGAFLDFYHTNAYKASQVERVSKLFQEGYVQPGDRFLVTDIWHFGITAIRYMSELTGVPVKIYAIAHAGAYDPSDILGMRLGSEWASNQERAWFYACDEVFFATEFHKNIFVENLNIPEADRHRAVVEAQPYDYLNLLYFQSQKAKKNKVVFTHRLNDDKQPEIFRDLRDHLPSDIEAVMTQEENLSKQEYYDLLSECKVTFSCSLHENLGIGMIESVILGAIPLVPNRACYPEVHLVENVYPTEWTKDFNSYLQNRDKLVNIITEYVRNYERYSGNYRSRIERIQKFIAPNYMFQRLTE